ARVIREQVRPQREWLREEIHAAVQGILLVKRRQFARLPRLDQLAYGSVGQQPALHQPGENRQPLAARNVLIEGRIQCARLRQRQKAVGLRALEIVQESVRLDLHLVEVERAETTHLVVAHVAHFHDIALDLVLDPELVLLYIRRAQVRVHYAYGVERVQIV